MEDDCPVSNPALYAQLTIEALERLRGVRVNISLGDTAAVVSESLRKMDGAARIRESWASNLQIYPQIVYWSESGMGQIHAGMSSENSACHLGAMEDAAAEAIKEDIVNWIVMIAVKEEGRLQPEFAIMKSGNDIYIYCPFYDVSQRPPRGASRRSVSQLPIIGGQAHRMIFAMRIAASLPIPSIPSIYVGGDENDPAKSREYTLRWIAKQTALYLNKKSLVEGPDWEMVQQG